MDLRVVVLRVVVLRVVVLRVVDLQAVILRAAVVLRAVITSNALQVQDPQVRIASREAFGGTSSEAKNRLERSGGTRRALGLTQGRGPAWRDSKLRIQSVIDRWDAATSFADAAIGAIRQSSMP